MGKTNMALLKQKQAELNKNRKGGNSDWDKLEDGSNVRRILFPKGDEDWFYKEGLIHWYETEDPDSGETVNRSFTCPKTWGDKNKCPFCDMAAKLRQSDIQKEKDLAGKFRAGRRILCNVIARDADSDEPKVLDVKVSVLNAIIDAMTDPDYGDITDYELGRDITIKKSGMGMSTKYSATIKPKESIASKEYSEEELDEKMADLNSFFTEIDDDDLQEIFDDFVERLDIFTDEPKASKKKADRKPDRRKPDPEPDEDEDEEDEDGDEYDDMTLKELRIECDDRGIEWSKSDKAADLRGYLRDDDEEQDEDDSDEPEDDDDEEEDEDDLKSSIASAIGNRRRGRK